METARSKQTRKIVCWVICSVAILVLAFFATTLGIQRIRRDAWIEKNEKYIADLTEAMSQKELVRTGDIFTFDFDRAYVFNDPYLTGKGFAKRYGLDISIEEVSSPGTEYIHRIVFVDEAGDFVYEFRYNAGQLIVREEGVIIYPETVIEKCPPAGNEVFTVLFQSSERYDEKTAE